MTIDKRAIPALVLTWLLILGMPVGAAKVVNEVVPIDDIVFNPCTNEDVHIVGEAHTVGTLTENDNTHHLSAHVNFNVEGVGLTSGESYRATATGMASENVTSENNEIGEASVILRTIFIGNGSLPNANEFAHAHITVTPNGDTTSTFVIDRLTCN